MYIFVHDGLPNIDKKIACFRCRRHIERDIVYKKIIIVSGGRSRRRGGRRGRGRGRRGYRRR